MDNHRLRVPCEVLTYELGGIAAVGPDDRTAVDRRYFTVDELSRFRLSEVHQSADPIFTPVQAIAYHERLSRTAPQKRLVEHTRTLFFLDAAGDPAALKQPQPFRRLGRLGLVYETYTLALTEELLAAVLGTKLTADVRNRLGTSNLSGYLGGSMLATRFGGAVTGEYWIRSGVAGFASDASEHFYLPERFTDAFGNVTTLEFDANNDLFLESSADALGNTTRVTRFDFRVLAPRELSDINGNLTEVWFDVLGRPAAMARKGKGSEGDNLTGFTDVLANPPAAALTAFFAQADLDETQARVWLGSATARHLYSFGETHTPGSSITWAAHPACACGIVREQHVSQLTGGAESPIQAAFEYSDGLGAVIVKKIQAEPAAAGQPLRWIGSGKTVLNNKGKAVKQYEPYFSPSTVGHRFEDPPQVGATAVVYYDAAGRTVRTDLPDGSFSRVDFSPWHARAFDANDTVKDAGNPWFTRMSAAGASMEDRRAAQLAAEHAGTPALTIFDSLGRAVVAVAHNRIRNSAGALEDEQYVTFTKLDAEGKPLWIRDARQNLVMQYVAPPVASNSVTDPGVFVPCYDVVGNVLFQHSMDAGGRWMLNDAGGKPMLGWDSRGHAFRASYDALHRPVASFVTGADPTNPTREVQYEKVVYGDTPGNGLTDPQRTDGNLRGRLFQHYDTAGVITNRGRNLATGGEESFDFKGNLLRSSRQLASDYRKTTDWSIPPVLDAERFISSARYDALNRPVQSVAAHSDRAGATLNVVQPAFNPAGLLDRIDVWLERAQEPATLLDGTTAQLHAVTNIDYDAKGQRLRIEYNAAASRVVTHFTRDPDTFRLTRLVTTRPAHADPATRTLQDLTYSYDAVGNITAIRDDAQAKVFFENSAIEPRQAYRYDALYRLTTAEGREHAAQQNVQRDFQTSEPVIGVPFPNSPEALQRYVEEYAYDAVGNILGWRHTGGTVERWVRRYQYALDSNRLLATRLPGDPDNLPHYTAAPGYTAKYSYDAHGSMLSMPHLPGMEWNFREQLQATTTQVVGAGVLPEKTY